MSTNHFIIVYLWLKIAHNRYPGTNTSVVLIISTFLQIQITFSSHALCPPYYVYLESGNDCLFTLYTCGNSSHARKQCDENSGMLVSLIYNVKHFIDVCEFAKKRLPNNSSFYLGAHRNEDKFIWELNSTDVSFPPTLMFTDKGYDCLEMIVSDKGCYLNNAPCHKQTWPICEFPHVNPCVYNNGGCKGQCIPRHRGDRKCVSSNEEGIQKTDVDFTCRPNSVEINGLCIGEDRSEGTTIVKFGYCKQTFGNSFLSLDSIEKFNRYCLAYQSTLTNAIEYFFLNGLYDKNKNKVRWGRRYDSEPLEWCDEFDSHRTFDETYRNRIMLKVSSIKCCLIVDPQIITAKGACGLLSPNVCEDKPIKVCTDGRYRCVPKSGFRQFKCVCGPGFSTVNEKCVDMDECDADNGGCHHGCVNTLGSRECSCWEGYQLFNETECRYSDKCMNSEGKDVCPININVTADGLDCDALEEKREEKHQGYGKYRKISDEVIIDTLTGLIVLCFLIIVCLKCICYTLKR